MICRSHYLSSRHDLVIHYNDYILHGRLLSVSLRVAVSVSVLAFPCHLCPPLCGRQGFPALSPTFPLPSSSLRYPRSCIEATTQAPGHVWRCFVKLYMRPEENLKLQ